MIFQNKYNAEQGSAIVWVLIAVALFAALNFAFNSGSRTSTATLSDAEANSYANQIIQYGNEVKSTVKRLQLRGCSDTEISFENNVLTEYENPNAPDNKSCHVFDIAGGGLQIKSYAYELESIDFIGAFINGVSISGVGSDCASSDCSELIYTVRLSISSSSNAVKNKAQKICNAINKFLNKNPDVINVIWGDDTPSSPSDYRFQGEYKNSLNISDPLIHSSLNHCGQVSSKLYSYQKVLIPR